MLVSVPGPEGQYLLQGERIRVSGDSVAEALGALGENPSIDDLADALIALAGEASVRRRLEIEELWLVALSELRDQVETLEAKFEDRERRAAAAEADAVLARVGRRSRRHGVSITNRGEGRS